MHKYTILCIKMNNYTENLSQFFADVTKWDKFCHNKMTKSVRCDKNGTNFVITKVPKV